MHNVHVDVVAAIRAGDRQAAGLLGTITEIAGTPPIVVHSSAETELALRGRGLDLLVFDPGVVDPAVVTTDHASTAPIVGWLPRRSPAHVADLLDAGVDDVLDPSMASIEVAARLRRVVSRRAPHVPSRPVTLGCLYVDVRLREATWDGESLALTPREVEVLQVLAAAAGQPVSREVIYRQVWRWTMPRGDRTVDVNVKRLRQKLAAIPVEVVTTPGVGYRISVHDPDPAVTGL
jgi:DNA-binding response OmpR family regulator